MRFKDENGKEYEESGEFGATVNDQRHFVIRPIIEAKKWEVEINGNVFQNIDSHTRIEVLLKNPFSVYHSELIKDAVEAMMSEIFSPCQTLVMDANHPFLNTIHKARKALQS